MDTLFHTLLAATAVGFFVSAVSRTNRLFYLYCEIAMLVILTITASMLGWVLGQENIARTVRACMAEAGCNISSALESNYLPMLLYPIGAAIYVGFLVAVRKLAMKIHHE